MKNFQEGNFALNRNGETVELSKKEIESKEFNEEDYSPIPLNSDQLIKLGFDKQHERVYRKGHAFENTNPETPTHFQIRSGSFIVGSSSSVHELQNYFKDIQDETMEKPISLPTMNTLNILDVVGHWATKDKKFSISFRGDGTFEQFN